MASQVAGHQVHVVGKVFPRARYVRHLRLSAEFAFGSDFAGHARDFSGEHAKLLDHRVDEVCRAQELAFQRTSIHIQPHALRKIALSDGGDGARHLSRWPEQVLDQRVD